MTRNTDIWDRGQDSAMITPAPGYEGAFRCSLCGSTELMPQVLREGEDIVVELHCTMCDNYYRWRQRVWPSQ